MTKRADPLCPPCGEGGAAGFTPAALLCAQKAIASTIRKDEKVLATLGAKQPQDTAQQSRVARQLRVLTLAAAFIGHALGESPRPACTAPDLAEAAGLLSALTRQVQSILPKFKAGTPQHTLARRRVQAFQIAQALIGRAQKEAQ